MRATCHFLSVTVLSVLTLAAAGCQSGGGSRFAWMNPWSKSPADASLVARSAPQLPSAGATPPGGEGAALANSAAPAFDAGSTSTIAAAPTASYPTTGLGAAAPAVAPTSGYPQTGSGLPGGGPPSYPATATASTARPKPPTAAPAMAGPPQVASVLPSLNKPAPTMPNSSMPSRSQPSTGSGPYDPSGYQESAAVATATPSFPPNRYGSPDASASPSSPYRSVASAPADAGSSALASPPSSPPSSPAGRYGGVATATPMSSTTQGFPSPTAPAGRYPAVASASPAAVATPTASASPYPQAGISPAPPVTPGLGSLPGTAVAPASAEVKIASAPGEYRPGGTTSYPVSVASRAAPGPAGSTPASYPATGAAPADNQPGSSYPGSSSPAPAYPTTPSSRY